MTNLRIATLVACSMLSLAACGEADKVEQGSSTGAASNTAEATVEKPAGSLMETGFGQSDIYVALIAIVQNTSDKVGQTVTVQFNIKDANDELLASESQVEYFSGAGQKLLVQTQAELPKGKKAAKVDATLLVEDKGSFSSEPFPEIKTGPVKLVKSEYGEGFEAKVEVTNPKTEPLKSPRVGVVCYSTEKRIVGGGFTFPDLVPPSGKAVAEMDLLITGKPSSCVAYASPGAFED
ncbi:hypothetical protein FHG89_00540 [Micromonospora orduensis]|uniref:DUF4352 domain-containing protein n=1 Tax=Micromonospora orduensis TaxID=1420891 RepID=A0A5C4R068_9ACTN|nr:hypothetical protein [Micromonospora orduensis]TNH31768.1 hypothetical protein FHG89_00540 [Micromonospora orduensis]